MGIFICVAVLCIIVLVFRKKKNNNSKPKVSGNYKSIFWGSEDFDSERSLLNKLEEITPFKRFTKDDSEQAKKDNKENYHKDNQQKMGELIDAGAKIVIASGANPLTVVERVGIDVITPEVVFQKKCGLATRVISTASVNTSDIIFVNHWLEKVTEKRQASVVGQAIVGGIVAGGAGAVVGAANSANQNASGGKEVTAGLLKYYFLSLMYSGDTVDAIYISTSVIDEFGEPPLEFVTNKRKNYWVIEATNRNRMVGGCDKDTYDAYIAYIDKVLKHYKANAKYKGRFAILQSSADENK